MILELNNKTGFKSRDRIINIFSLDNSPFYIKKNEESEIHFNLPSGKYKTNNNIIESKLKNYTLKALPRPNRNIPLPKLSDIKIIYTNNENKCSIDVDNHEIFMDYSLAILPTPIVDFVKAHELGHYFYFGKGEQSEKDCDNFAYNALIGIGYNPSQVTYAANEILSNKKFAQIRKNCIYKHSLNSFN